MSPVEVTLATARVSRIRIEAEGPTVGDVSAALNGVADRMAGLNGFEDAPFHGQEVYERNLDEPIDSSTTYSGRLILHPRIG